MFFASNQLITLSRTFLEYSFQLINKMKYIQYVMLAALIVISEQVQWSCKDFKLTDDKHCNCSQIKEVYEIKCTELNVTFRIGRFDDVEILCNEVLTSPVTLPVGLGSVNALRIENCLSPEVSVRDIINYLGIGKLWSLSVAGKLDGLAKGQLAKLTNNVRLEGLGLTHIEQDVFVNQNTTESDITTLYLGRNNISHLDDTVFVKLKKLLHLDLSYNLLSTLPDGLFKYNKNLTTLNFSHNNLQNISSNLFVNQNELKELDLSHNRLTHLGSQWVGLDGLTHLYLSYNQLTNDGVGEGKESVLKHLQQQLWLLDISNNNLTRVQQDWLGEKRFVRLNNNNIQTFKVDSSLNRTGAMTVDLSGNNITEVDINIPESFTGSVGVYLEDNPLSCDCHLHPLARLAKGDQLFSFPVSFLDVGSTTCGSPPSLKGRLILGLFLEEFTCPISEGCPPPCSCYYQPEGGYTVVNCTGVGLEGLPQSLPVHQNSNQTKIILSDSKLDQSSFTFTPDLWPNVTELDLSNTSLTTFTVSGGVGPLKHLNLSHNQLTFLSDDTVRHLQSLDSLSLNNNPWSCSSDGSEAWKLINNLCKTPI